MFTYKGEKARVVFLSRDGKELGNEVLNVPVAHQRPLRLSLRKAAGRTGQQQHAALPSFSLIGQAHAQERPASSGTAKSNTRRCAKRQRQSQGGAEGRSSGECAAGSAAVVGYQLARQRRASQAKRSWKRVARPSPACRRRPTMMVPSEQRVRIAVLASTKQSQLGAEPGPRAVGSL